MVWRELTYAKFWLWHPSETWALITWIVYAAYLHAMTMSSWRQRIATVFNMLGFACMIINMLSVCNSPEMLMIPNFHLDFMQ
jgi:ABC-type transport system involved in cytochrome c biogenesis permease subunit